MQCTDLGNLTIKIQFCYYSYDRNKSVVMEKTSGIRCNSTKTQLILLSEVMDAVMIPLVQTRSNVHIVNSVAVSSANSLFFLTVSIMKQQCTHVAVMGINNSFMGIGRLCVLGRTLENPVVFFCESL